MNSLPGNLLQTGLSQALGLALPEAAGLPQMPQKSANFSTLLQAPETAEATPEAVPLALLAQIPAIIDALPGGNTENAGGKAGGKGLPVLPDAADAADPDEPEAPGLAQVIEALPPALAALLVPELQPLAAPIAALSPDPALNTDGGEHLTASAPPPAAAPQLAALPASVVIPPELRAAIAAAVQQAPATGQPSRAAPQMPLPSAPVQLAAITVEPASPAPAVSAAPALVLQAAAERPTALGPAAPATIAPPAAVLPVAQPIHPAAAPIAAAAEPDASAPEQAPAQKATPGQPAPSARAQEFSVTAREDTKPAPPAAPGVLPGSPLTLSASLPSSPQSVAVPQVQAAAPADTPQDFATLVSRLAEAREAASPHFVRTSLAHAQFGQVSLQFRTEDSGLSVTMASSDPDFTASVQAAAASLAANAQSSGDTPRDGQTATWSGQQQHASPGGQASGQGEARPDGASGQNGAQARQSSAPRQAGRDAGSASGERGNGDGASAQAAPRTRRSGLYA